MAYAKSRQIRCTWTKEESAFTTRLARECNAAIDCARLVWASRNRAGDRRGGADLLMAMFVVLMARFLGEVGWAGTPTRPVPCVRTAGDDAFAGPSLLEPLGELTNALLHPAAGLLAVLVFSALAFAGVLRPIADGEPLLAAFSEIAFPAARRIVVTPGTAFLSGMLALSIHLDVGRKLINRHACDDDAT